MKIRDGNKSNGFNVDGNLSFNTDNGYNISFPKKPNWFQRLLYKLLGFEVTKKDGNNK